MRRAVFGGRAAGGVGANGALADARLRVPPGAAGTGRPQLLAQTSRQVCSWLACDGCGRRRTMIQHCWCCHQRHQASLCHPVCTYDHMATLLHVNLLVR